MSRGAVWEPSGGRAASAAPWPRARGEGSYPGCGAASPAGRCGGGGGFFGFPLTRVPAVGARPVPLSRSAQGLAFPAEAASPSRPRGLAGARRGCRCGRGCRFSSPGASVTFLLSWGTRQTCYIDYVHLLFLHAVSCSVFFHFRHFSWILQQFRLNIGLFISVAELIGLSGYSYTEVAPQLKVGWLLPEAQKPMGKLCGAVMEEHLLLLVSRGVAVSL